MNCSKSTLTALIALAAFMAPIHAKEEQKLILLDFGFLKAVDGKDYGITKNHIGFTWQLLLELKKIQDGVKGNNGEYTGLFIVDGNRYSVRALRKKEAEYNLELCELSALNPDHKNQDAVRRKKELDAVLTKRRTQLNDTLDEVKRYFDGKVLPFLNYAHGLKSIMIPLIDESCIQRNRADSSLRTWGQCEDGKESQMVNNEIKSFKAFDEFLTDLIHFLQDFIHSCPKARTQFLESVKQKLHPHDEK